EMGTMGVLNAAFKGASLVHDLTDEAVNIIRDATGRVVGATIVGRAPTRNGTQIIDFRLPSFATLSNGVLQIYGTTENDVINLTQSAGTITAQLGDDPPV